MKYLPKNQNKEAWEFFTIPNCQGLTHLWHFSQFLQLFLINLYELLSVTISLYILDKGVWTSESTKIQYF